MGRLAPRDEVMYHIGLSADMVEGAKYALVPGDPGRVEGLAKALDEKATFLGTHRDYTSWLAHVAGEAVLVMSTGMGGPCVTFAVEEGARIGISTFIRVGTTGSLQEYLDIGEVVINYGSVRMDGASRAYAPIAYPAIADMDVVQALRQAARELDIPHSTGISVSTDSFWPGQERYDSFGAYVRKSLQGTLTDWKHLHCTNYEMENATLFTLTSVLGLRGGSVCGVVAKRTDSEAVATKAEYEVGEKRFQAIAYRALEILIAQDKKNKFAIDFQFPCGIMTCE